MIKAHSPVEVTLKRFKLCCFAIIENIIWTARYFCEFENHIYISTVYIIIWQRLKSNKSCVLLDGGDIFEANLAELV